MQKMPERIKSLLTEAGRQQILGPEKGFNEHQLPKVSIVIPSFNSATMIVKTLESLLIQDYAEFEIIIIDAGSIDRTIEIVKGMQDPRLKVYTVSGFSRTEMMNKGITHATGIYINFLFPGDFYIHKTTLKQMMILASTQHLPELVYCGTMLRNGRTEVTLLYRKLNMSILKDGHQPTSLQGCWFKLGVFRKIGKFYGYELRGGFDLLCRFMIDGTLTFYSTNLVLVDYDLRLVSRKTVIQHFVESWKIIKKYFGIFAALKWLFKQKDLTVYFKLWKRTFRTAFLGR